MNRTKEKGYVEQFIRTINSSGAMSRGGECCKDSLGTKKLLIVRLLAGNELNQNWKQIENTDGHENWLGIGCVARKMCTIVLLTRCSHWSSSWPCASGYVVVAGASLDALFPWVWGFCCSCLLGVSWSRRYAGTHSKSKFMSQATVRCELYF